MTKLLLLTLLALPLTAFDAKSEVAQFKETMDRAVASKDWDTYSKGLTADFLSISRNGSIRDVKAALDLLRNNSAPSDLKQEQLKAIVYGDTVLELIKESWTGNDGSKHQGYVHLVYVKQSGTWKLASRTATTIPTAK